MQRYGHTDGSFLNPCWASASLTDMKLLDVALFFFFYPFSTSSSGTADREESARKFPPPVWPFHMSSSSRQNVSSVVNKEADTDSLVVVLVNSAAVLLVMVTTDTLDNWYVVFTHHIFSVYKSYLNVTLIPPPAELKPPPPQSRRNTLSCLKGAEPGILLSASTPDSISIIPSSEVASQLSSPAAGPSRSDVSGCHGRRGMMQAIKNERRASKVRLQSGAECLSGDLRCSRSTGAETEINR